MKLKTTAVFTAEELSILIAANMENAVAKVSVPRKEGGAPTATIEVSAEVLAQSIADGLSTEDNEVTVEDLAGMSMSVKKPTEGQEAGNIELTY